MQLVHIGFSHKHSPFEFLGRVAIAPGAVESFLRALTRDGPVSEAVAIATCNRVEFTVATRDPSGASHFLLSALARERGIDAGMLVEHAIVRRGLDAVRHLFAVAAGIDSLVVGEPEIQGQVRAALETARSAGTAGPLVAGLYNRALRAGSRARAETSIGRGKVSIATVAAQLIAERVADLPRRTVLVIGTGEMGRQTARALADGGAGTLLLANRSSESAQAAASSIGGVAVPMEELRDALRRADVAICATGAQHHLVTRAMAETAGACVYLDLSSPPNVAPDVREVAGASVLTLADLREIAEQNAARRVGEIAAVEALIEEEVARFEKWATSTKRERTTTHGAERG